MIARVALLTCRVSDCTHRHPAKAVAVLSLLWLAGLFVHAKITEHDRFNASFRSAVWEWQQAGEGARPMNREDREQLIAQLLAPEPPERWTMAEKLGSWREPAALRPLIATMEDAARTQRTCLISQALGKLGKAEAIPALVEAAQHRSNVDLRVCSTHSLGQIGDERALSAGITARLRPLMSE